MTRSPLPAPRSACELNSREANPVAIHHELSALDLEQRSVQPTLADDRPQCSGPKLLMVRDNDGGRSVIGKPLEDDMAAFPTNLDEALCLQN